MIDVESTGWSGEGTFTQVLVDHLRSVDEVRLLRVEDAPASRSEADYNFISNEIFVAFSDRTETTREMRFGFIPVSRTVARKAMTIAGLERVLAEAAHIGPPDYSDDGMLQYLRAERIVPPYQTRGYKLVELVRIYELGARSPS
jgi:hypothetical protein